ncbi:MAG: amidohydrolase family protein [Anaerolineae bacterium]
MTILDAHCHIFPPELIAQRQTLAAREPWFGHLYRNPRNRMATAEDLVRSMERAQVDQAVIFGFAFADPGLCHVCNQYVLEVAHRWPGVLLPFAVVQPRAKREALRELVACCEAGALGLGELLPDGQGYALDDWPILNPLFALMREPRRPIMCHLNEQLGHLYAGKGKQGPAAGYTLGSHYPANPVILSHWGGGLPFYELMPEVRQALSNVYYDTAASLFLYDDEIYNSVLRWMPDKVLWGSDYPLLSQKRFRQRIGALNLSPENTERLLYRNATRVLGLLTP